MCIFQATDDDGNGLSATVPLTILISDNNDNPPVFNESIYTVFLNEGTMKFNKEVILTAIDLDTTSSIVYTIVEGNDDNLFNIDSKTGKLKVTNNKRSRLFNGTHLHEYMLKVEVSFCLFLLFCMI